LFVLFLFGVLIMSFEKGRLIKNLLYGVTHPLEMAREKPIMFMLLVGGGILGLGLLQGWWSMDSITGLLN
jgi:hypothetical protein